MPRLAPDKFADLHTHTNFSDGTFSPQEVIRLAKQSNLYAIAITDHDTVRGLDAAQEESLRQGIEFIPGIELTAETNSAEAHFLGYFIDWRQRWLQDKLQEIANVRVERMHQMVEKLKSLGIEIEAEDVFKLAGRGSVGRLHLARAMQEKGICSVHEAFQKYIGDKGPAYVVRFMLSPKEAIGVIIRLRGVAVLAHPYNLEQKDIISSFVDMGLRGIEVYYPEHDANTVQYYKSLAEKSGLLVTGGSDFHGTAKPDVSLGKVRIPYGLVENLRAAKPKI